MLKAYALHDLEVGLGRRSARVLRAHGCHAAPARLTCPAAACRRVRLVCQLSFSMLPPTHPLSLAPLPLQASYCQGMAFVAGENLRTKTPFG